MSKYGFGQKYINKETPIWAKNTFRAILYILGLTTIFLANYGESVLHLSKEQIIIYSGLASFFTLAIHGLIKLIGFKVSQIKLENE